MAFVGDTVIYRTSFHGVYKPLVQESTQSCFVSFLWTWFPWDSESHCSCNSHDLLDVHLQLARIHILSYLCWWNFQLPLRVFFHVWGSISQFRSLYFEWGVYVSCLLLLFPTLTGPMSVDDGMLVSIRQSRKKVTKKSKCCTSQWGRCALMGAH